MSEALYVILRGRRQICIEIVAVCMTNSDCLVSTYGTSCYLPIKSLAFFCLASKIVIFYDVVKTYHATVANLTSHLCIIW